MSDSLSPTRFGFLSRYWHDSLAWTRAADILAVLTAIFLPWSTSLVSITIVLWVLALAPTLDLARLRLTFARAECALPVGLFVLAVAGTFWATDIPWAARLHGINPVAKLLVIPLLVYHFEKSTRGMWVFIAFGISCVALLLLSWGLYATGRYLASGSLGVPVKDYIVQSQEFALCALAALGAAMLFLDKGRSAVAYFLIALAITFICNMVFVATSRTALVCIPVLFLIFGFRFFGKLGVFSAALATFLIAVTAWNLSPALRMRVSDVAVEYQLYNSQNAITSTGQRLEYWRKSIKFIERAPLFGQGTGATRVLFERDAVGQTGVSSDVVGNPHNQTFNVMIQWGVLGAILLYAMWLSHLLLFQYAGLAGWIGLAAVVENIVSSLFNSHIFDFVQGWMYVIAVGVAAGMIRQQRSSPIIAQSLISRSDAVL